MSNKKLEVQILKLKEALSYAEAIQDLDERIEHGRHVNFSKSTRTEYIEKYIEIMAEIVESATEHDFNKVVTIYVLDHEGKIKVGFRSKVNAANKCDY